jgi:hypothetical protein
MVTPFQDILIGIATISAPIIGAQYVMHRQNTKKIREFLDLMINFPMHIHLNGKIYYPKGWGPERREATKYGK